jgi:hypothetical protein
LKIKAGRKSIANCPEFSKGKRSHEQQLHIAAVDGILWREQDCNEAMSLRAGTHLGPYEIVYLIGAGQNGGSVPGTGSSLAIKNMHVCPRFGQTCCVVRS